MSKRTKDPETTHKKYKSGYVHVNGLDMYYEIHGIGRPLVLLHGAFMSATVYPALAESRQVIAVDLQGHGDAPPTLTVLLPSRKWRTTQRLF